MEQMTDLAARGGQIVVAIGKTWVGSGEQEASKGAQGLVHFIEISGVLWLLHQMSCWLATVPTQHDHVSLVSTALFWSAWVTVEPFHA